MKRSYPAVEAVLAATNTVKDLDEAVALMEKVVARIAALTTAPGLSGLSEQEAALHRAISLVARYASYTKYQEQK